ncbi:MULTISPECIES: 2-keto-4-pentenoate hydratase [Streptomyces]|uniref:2-keto-4-pentenoate hydratase n=1 Tax=Streptomyces TaxID=1883 RepID=UPI001E4228E5|nr:MULTISPECIES: fumarylacetoacetate hydrolase family protein [Streptomyces]UFQ16898.1 fumarylacetoacetate hydrolase family protein [Streptomyces huasconensis]WCL86501.1 fumarylacetoacetate hydrolase family protein [Streptomyces sp. JCM 35825]
MTSSPQQALHRQLAAELRASGRDRRPVPPLSARHPDLTVANAYAIQREVRALDLADGARLAGHKIGITSEAIQRMFGIDQPDFGYLADHMLVPDGVCLRPDRFIAPKVEGELAFRMGEDLHGGSVTARDVLDATAAVLPALEVLDSRIADWKIQLVDTVADNASCALAVLGAEVSPEGIDLAAEQMVFEAGTTVHTAHGSAVLGHPAESVACLVRILHTFGEGVRAGDIVLAGAWAAAVDLLPGGTAKASFGALGSVSLSMEGQS